MQLVLLTPPPIQQDPPSTTSPNVDDAATGSSDKRNLDVVKSAQGGAGVKVLKMWRRQKTNGVWSAWMLVWSIPDNINGGYKVTGQPSDTTRIKKSNNTKFDSGVEVVGETESANSDGNSVTAAADFNNKT